MLRIGICDDDEQFTVQLEKCVLKYAGKKGISVDIQIFVSSRELFSNINEEGLFDILFLDIELGNETGIDIGKFIRSDLKYEAMQIVYISINDQYALQLFETRPMNFLIKPIDYNNVEHVMDEYGRVYHFQNHFFSYHIGKRQYSMNANCIMYFQSQGKKIQMITQHGTEMFYGKLSDVILQLNEQVFCVVHKSFVVNMHYAVQYKNDCVVMVDGMIIPISQSMRHNVREKLLGEIV